MSGDEIDTLKALMSRLDRHAFSAFALEMVGPDRVEEPILPLPQAGEGIFCQPLLESYGRSVHRAIILHYIPLHLLEATDSIRPAEDPTFVSRVRRVLKHYRGKKGAFGMVSPYLEKTDALSSLNIVTNFHLPKSSLTPDMIIPPYSDLMDKLRFGDRPLFVGCYDSFIQLDPQGTQDTFRRFIASHRDGLRISLAMGEVRVDSFATEASVIGGFPGGPESPCEPVYVSRSEKLSEHLAEFQELVSRRASEEELERFVTAHYREVFGFKYDRIESQLWLRFRHLDIADRHRRLDVFLRNSVTNDWELFELKRPIPLTGTYRDVPVLKSEVVKAVQQIRAYERLLRGDRVKEHLARLGIEYYEPELNLVVGRTPSVPIAQWRWLQATAGRDVKLLTYDQLADEMRIRIAARGSVSGHAD